MIEQQNPWEIDWGSTPAQRGPPQPIIPRTPPPRYPDEAVTGQGRAAAAPFEGRRAAADAQNAEFRARNEPRTAAREANRERDTQVTTYRTEFNNQPTVRDFNNTRNAYLQLRTLGQGGNGVSDVALIFSFMRALDPNSTVREGEFATAQNTAGIPGQVQNMYNQALRGERLTPEQRNQMVSTAADLVRARSGPYNEVARRYRRLIQPLGVDPGPMIPMSEASMTDDDWAAWRRANPNVTDEQYRQRRFPYADQEGVRIGIPTERAPAGSHIEFAMDNLPSEMIAGVTGTEASSGPEYAWTDSELAQISDAVRNSTPETTGADLDRLARSFPGIDGQGNHGLGNGDALLRQWRESQAPPGPGQLPIRPPDISDARGEGGIFEGADAVGRGAADTASLGLSDEFSALGDTLFRGGTYTQNLRRQRAIDSYDQENQPIPRIGGQFVGALALPTGAPGAGREAAVAALRGGAARSEAIRAARTGAARRLGIEGAGYGAAYGFGSGDGGVLDRFAHAAEDATLGGISGYGLGRAGLGGPRIARDDAPPLVNADTGRLNQPLGEVSSAERVAAGRAYGIDLPMGAAGNRGAAIFEKGLDNTPGSAGVMEDARRGASRIAGREGQSLEAQVTDAVEREGARYGDASTAYAGGQAAQRGGQNWIDRATGVRGAEDRGVVGRVYDAIPVPPGSPAVVDNSRTALTELTSAFESNADMADAFRNTNLERYRGALEQGGLSWRDLNDFRSRIGNKIGDMRFSEDPSIGQLRHLYGALSEDMRATATARGPRALRAFERANNLNREVENRIETALVRILGDDARRNPEAAFNAIQTIARSGRGSSNLDQMRQVRASLSRRRAGATNSEWDEVAGAVIRLAGQPANSAGREFNPGTFVQTYADMSEDARNLLFGGSQRRQELRRALDGFVAVNQRLAGSNALRNTSQTVPGITAVGLVGSTVGAVANPLTGLTLAGGLVGANRLAALWTNPKFVRWATGYTRLLGREGSEAALAGRRESLLRLARSTPAIAAEIAEIDQQLFPEGAQPRPVPPRRSSRLRTIAPTPGRSATPDQRRLAPAQPF